MCLCYSCEHSIQSPPLFLLYFPSLLTHLLSQGCISHTLAVHSGKPSFPLYSRHSGNNEGRRSGSTKYCGRTKKDGFKKLSIYNLAVTGFSETVQSIQMSRLVNQKRLHTALQHSGASQTKKSGLNRNFAVLFCFALFF